MKNVLITGVSRGIGQALAKKFLDNGYFVIGTSTSGQASLTSDNLLVLQLDLADANSIEQCAKKVLGLEKPISILINNAAVYIDADSGPEIDMEVLRKTFAIDLMGPVDFTQQVLPAIQPGAHIVNISSRQGSLERAVNTSDPAYRISKAALNMFTRILAARLKDTITVSSVHPGAVKTDMGAADASMEPAEAAKYLYDLAISQPETGQFWFKGEKFPW